MATRYLFYRLPGAVFPLCFRMAGTEWQLRVYLVHQAHCWRCDLEGQSRWIVHGGSYQQTVEHELRETGVEIPAHTFVGAAFRHLVKLGLAEEVHQTDANGDERR